jgi:replicative DNA helicase
MTAQEVNDGLICRAGQIDTQAIRRGLYRSKIRETANSISDLPVYIFDQPGVTVPRIHAELRRLKAEKGIKLAVVDYLQLVTPVGRHETRAEAVSQMSRGMKLIAMDLGIGVILLSQLSRQEKGNGGKLRRPELSDLKESSSIEQDANVVIMLHTEYQMSPMQDYPTEVHIKKQRGGPVGMIPFLWRKSTGTFIEELA